MSDWDESTVPQTPINVLIPATPTDPSKPDQSHLIVFTGDSSFVFELPIDGEVMIGRAEHCALRIEDPKTSREHAKIVMTLGHAEAVDCLSQNGTRVNGETLAKARALISGDEIGVGGATLVFYSRLRTSSRFTELDFTEFRRRLDVEIERAIRFGRPLTMMAIVFGGAYIDRRQIAATLGPELRKTDLAAWDGDDRLLILLPETPQEQAIKAAYRLLDMLTPFAPAARCGYASAPASGSDADTLISSARSAARGADTGMILSAKASGKTVSIGTHTAIVADPAMIRLYQLIERLAPTDLPALILGETGTGKELAACALHEWSSRKQRPLVTLNCAAIPEPLLESELFGYAKGAFTGANEAKAGLLELSDRGTVFLDEIGDLPLAAQAKLLRVLEAKKINRLGSLTEIEVDLRVIAATHRNLEDDVKTGRFRRDLYFRLAGALLWIPPLRVRTQELSILAETFLAAGCARAKTPAKTLSDRAIDRLRNYAWPGNLRELKNLMEYVAATATDEIIEPRHFSERIADGAESTDPSNHEEPAEKLMPIEDLIRDVEKRHMLAALAATQWNQTRAAELIHMPLRTFQARVRQYGIRASKGDKSPTDI